MFQKKKDPYAYKTSTLTKEEILKEIVKCGKDPAYFINNYVKIKHPDRGIIDFRLFPFQDGLLTDFQTHRFIIINKSRQLGISTLTAAYATWLMMFHRGKEVYVVATKLSVATNLVRKVKLILKYLPAWLKIAKSVADNALSVELDNGSRITSSSNAEDAGRSEALSLLIIDEAAHIKKMDEVWASVKPTLATGGNCIALSSPKGAGTWFYDMWINAEAGKNDFFPTKLLWNIHPERNQAWFEHETRNMSPRKVAQEYECNFLMSGQTVIRGEDIKRIEEEEVCEPLFREGHDANLFIWKEYVAGHKYIMSADVARGDAEDSSTFHVFDLETLEQAAEYEGKMAPDVFGSFLYEWGGQYGYPLLVVENNNIGFATLNKLVDLQYPNLFYSEKGSHDYVEQYDAEGRSDTIPGIATSPKNRPRLIAKMEEYIRNKVFKVYSRRLVGEFKAFVWKEERPEAMSGHHDDLIMALAYACWIRETALIVNQRDIEYKKALLGAIMVTNSKFSTKVSGQAGYNKIYDMTVPDAEAQKELLAMKRRQQLIKEGKIPNNYPMPIFKG